ncbi:hypothetical protein YC2023_120920 [Brassica napus]
MGFEDHEAVLSGLCSGSGFMGFDLGFGSGPVYPIDVMSHDDVNSSRSRFDFLLSDYLYIRKFASSIKMERAKGGRKHLHLRNRLPKLHTVTPQWLKGDHPLAN